MTDREFYFRGIVSKLAFYATELAMENVNHLYNGNTFAEDCFTQILNRIYGWNLRNANDEQMNMEGVDLVDPEARIAIQVTTTDTRAKILHTIEEFNNSDKNLFQKYDRLCIFLLKETAKTFRKKFPDLKNGSFNPQEDILDFHKLTITIHSRFQTVDELAQLDAFLEKELLHTQPAEYNLNDWAKEYRAYWTKQVSFIPDKYCSLSDIFTIPPFLDCNGEFQDDLEEELLWNWSGKKEPDPELDHRMRVVFGDAGSGKTSLISWYLNRPENRYREIEVYRFANMTDIDWNCSIRDILKKIMIFLKITAISQLSRKTIILDGFDEVPMSPANRVDFLREIYHSWVDDENVDHFQLMITCRKTYVNSNWTNQEYPYLILKPYPAEKALEYAAKVTGEPIEKVSTRIKPFFSSNCRDFLAYPHILNLILAQKNLRFGTGMSIGKVYSAILSPANGIYGLRIFSPDGKISDPYDPWRKETLAEQCWLIDRISRRIAIYIFRNSYLKKASDMTCPLELVYSWIREEMQNSPGKELNADIISQGFFEITESEPYGKSYALRFISDSLYLYFAADTIYRSMKEVWNTAHFNPEKQKAAEQRLLDHLQYAPLSQEMLSMLKDLLKSDSITVSDFHWWETFWARLLRCGMLEDPTIYHDSRDGSCPDIMETNRLLQHIKRESMCFINMSNLIQVLFKLSKCSERILENENVSDSIAHYLRITTESGWYLAGINLDHYKLDGINISGLGCVHLSLAGASVQNARLIRCLFDGADLTNADLRNTSLNFSIFVRTKLCGANLEGVICKNSSGKEYRLPDFLLKNDLTGFRILKKDLTVLKKHSCSFPENCEYFYLNGKKTTFQEIK